MIELLVHTLLAEVGPDLSKFRSAARFASRLGLCPDNRVSGGKILSVRTRHVQNRAALTLRIAAHTQHHNQSALGHYYRRMRAKLGAPKAITATAHKLARVLYQLLTTGQPIRRASSPSGKLNINSGTSSISMHPPVHSGINSSLGRTGGCAFPIR